jgi:carbon monoxide dehydrogenase subunit G
MKLEHSFEVAAPVDRVWETLIDLEQVAPCLPGAAIVGHDDDGTYHGTFQVKLGPTTASYRGTIRIQEADAEAHVATLAARGSDKRGQGGATATIVNTLHSTDGGGTRVEAVTDFTITGRLASFGRGGMIKDISNRLLRDFSVCLQQRLDAEPALAAGEGGAATTAGDGAGMTAGEAAASAGAEARPEESAAAAGARRTARHGTAAASSGGRADLGHLTRAGRPRRPREGGRPRRPRAREGPRARGRGAREGAPRARQGAPLGLGDSRRGGVRRW